MELCVGRADPAVLRRPAARGDSARPDGLNFGTETPDGDASMVKVLASISGAPQSSVHSTRRPTCRIGRAGGSARGRRRIPGIRRRCAIGLATARCVHARYAWRPFSLKLMIRF